ncbi:MAG: PAS domain S-box protein [Desulfosarcina sp.]|nr:PAS domain S-box protein [Desulfobacterales bacterium]
MTNEQTPSPTRPNKDNGHGNHLRARDIIMETLLDTIPNPVFYMDREGRYQGCNITFADQILGVPKEAIIGCTLFDLPHAIPDHLAEVYAQQDAALLRSAGTQFYESEVQCADGVRRHFFFNKATFVDTRGQPAGIVGIMLDITERKHAEEALRKSEARLRRFHEDVHLGVFQSTVEGLLLDFNPAGARMFGYATPRDLLAAAGNDASRMYVDPTDRTRNMQLIAASETPVKIETRFRRRDGTSFTGYLHIWKVKDRKGRFLYLEGFIEDITERKQFEESLRESEKRLRFLSSKLLDAQEKESRRISMELHDDLGQNLAALKLQMLTMARRLQKNQTELKRESQSVLAFIDRIIESTRHLSRALNPAVIQDLKLCGTIKWMLRNFRKYATCDTTLAMDDIDPLFSQDQQIIIYRILQEALHNVNKHARARSVALTVRRRTRNVHIQVCDDGRGFDIDQALNRHVAERGLGLAALEERSHMLGGQLAITSEKGRGTCVALTIPITAQEGAA